MKKIRTLLLILLAAALVLVGVTAFLGSKKPEKILAAAAKNTSDAHSMRFQMDLGLDCVILNQVLSLHISSNGELTADPAVIHATVKTEVNGAAPKETEVYLETVGKETRTYIETGTGSWTVQRERTNPELASGAVAVLELANVLPETEPEAVSETELIFTGEIPASKVKLALQATGMLLHLQSAELLDRSVLETVTENLQAMPVRIRVDTEKRMITGYELDLTDTMQAILTASVQKGLEDVGLDVSAQDVMTVVQVTADVQFSAFDEVERIAIPDAAKK